MVTKRSLATMLSSLALAAAGCVDTHVLPSEVPGVGTSTSALVGASGGALDIADLHVTIPAGALHTDTMITVHVDDAHVPFTAYSPVVRFEPADLDLAEPIHVSIPFRGDGSRATGFSARAGLAFAPQPTEISGDVAIVELASLSSTYVGTACEGDECTCGGIGTLDLLVVVDDSSSMQEEQALLTAEFPGLFRALATGDLDGDGVQDVPAFDDVRVGITSTDLGSGTVSGIATCEVGYGNDGMLLDTPGGAAAASCGLPTYAPAWASYDASMPGGLAAFQSQLDCTAARGTQGCGYEQDLEAGLLALSPNAATSYTRPGWVPFAFPEGRVGQGDMANAGFLRDGSILAVIYVSDEDDCSMQSTEILSLDDPRYAATDLNLRCFAFDDHLIGVSSLVQGLVGLRPRPEDVVVGAVTGVPSGIPTTDFAAVLAEPSMTPSIDTANPSLLSQVCSSTNGLAFPAQRIVQSLQGIESAGGHAVLQSICDPSFAGFTDALTRALASRASGHC